MARSARFGPRFPLAGKAASTLARAALGTWARMNHLHSSDSAFAKKKHEHMRQKLAQGLPVYVAGMGLSGHNSGVSLVRFSPEGGASLISNDEEERFRGEKHYSGYPTNSVAMLKQRLNSLGLMPQDLSAITCSWNYVDWLGSAAAMLAEEFPKSLPLLRPAASPNWNFKHAVGIVEARKQLASQLDCDVPLIMENHHDCHAAFSYSASPFAKDDAPTIVTVLDGFGDQGSISFYEGRKGKLRCLHHNKSIFDSLGIFYSLISSSQGGWTSLSSEGRYMGAAAWGDGDRLTNPYYKRLRQIFGLFENGEVRLNRRMANWHNTGEIQPYAEPLRELLGEPISADSMWNPDAVLNVDEIDHSPITKERVDKAAATQLVFEDVLFHIVEHLIKTTGSHRLVMCGGTALNCVANMRLLERFDEAYYERHLGVRERLHLWVPPTPSDAGVPMGAAYSFAMNAGVDAQSPIQHAFYCGDAPKTSGIERAIHDDPDVDFLPLPSMRDGGADEIADFMAFVVSREGILGLFQGAAETGPRALGHRSILANPCHESTLDNLNSKVKHRERIRPLAPMVTLEEAKRLFELSEGASDDDYNAYNYMVLTARAKPEAQWLIPAVLHHDGTARVQIVRKESDPLTHAYLKGLGKRLGVEVSVNTSLNVGSPIVQTPKQAFEALHRAKALTGLVMVSEEGDAFLVWDRTETGPKDGGKRLKSLYRAWRQERAEDMMTDSAWPFVRSSLKRGFPSSSSQQGARRRIIPRRAERRERVDR